MKRLHHSRRQGNLLRMSVVLFTVLATTAVSTVSPVTAASRGARPQGMYDGLEQWNGTYDVVAQKTTTVTNASTPVASKVETINSKWQVKLGVLICNGVRPGDYCETLGAIQNVAAGTGSMGLGSNAPWPGSGSCLGPIQFKRDSSGNRSLAGHCTAEPSSYGIPGSGDRARIYLEFSGKDVSATGSSPLRFTVPDRLRIKAGVKYTSRSPFYSFCKPAVTGVERCGRPGTTNPTGGTPSATDPNYFTYSFYVNVTRGRLPFGLSLDRTTGAITGTVKKSARRGSYPVTVCAKSVGRYVAGQETDVCRKTHLIVI